MISKTLILINSFLLLATFGSDLFFSKIEITEKNKVVKLPSAIADPAMFCDGTLGENIFTDGDFGSGSTNNLPNDANGFAPSYAYQPSPPPNDGYYTITNNTTNWGSFAQTSWVNTGDNSSDPNGYMMVINASYEPGTFYVKTIDNLCENTLYQFSIDVINLMKTGGIQPNIDFLIDGVVAHSTGNVPVNNIWNTYGFTFTSPPGTTSLTLAIQNNAPGGQGNDLAIDNISFRACGPELFIETSIPFICEGVSTSISSSISGTQYATPFFQWQESTDGGLNWTDVAGANTQELFLGVPTDGFQYRLLVSNSPTTIDNPKCRIISNVEEIVISAVDFIIFDTLCEGLELQVGNSIYNSTGVYVDSFLTSYGCDSIVTSHLEIVPDFGITADFDLINPSCFGDQDGEISILDVQNGSGNYLYQWNDDPFQTQTDFEFLLAGEHQITIRDSYGCNSIFNLNLIDPLEFTIDLGPDVAISLGEKYDIEPQYNLPVESYVWLNTTNLECTLDCLNPTAAPVETSTYSIIATDANGCTATDEITITVDNTRHIFIPNAFSPDGDGANDYFTIYGGIDVVEVVSLNIFNRWGSVVFSKNNFQPNDNLIGWDGFFKGKKSAEGVYLFTSEILFKDGVVERFSGDVSIVK